MITRVINSRLPLMVMNPVKVFDIEYFTRLYQAGALPVFDTEFLDSDLILENAAALEADGILFGLRLKAHDGNLIEALKKRRFTNLDAIVVPLEKNDTPADFSLFADTRIVLEVKDIDMVNAIDAVSPHALLLKGNEAAGKVSAYSSFILMQWYLEKTGYPVFVQGGVGMHTTAGLFAAGVSGIVLDSQLLLADEAPVAKKFKELLGTLDENDTTEIAAGGDRYRVFAKLGTKIVKKLKQNAAALPEDKEGESAIYREIEQHIIGLDDPEAAFVQSLFYLGQDAVFAKYFSKSTTALEDMIADFFRQTGEHLDFVDAFDPVQPGTALAGEHGTTLPLIQGPMANISDNAKFAAKVFQAGALPFLAVGSLPEELADPMLKAGARNLERFGAGLVGIEAFNPCAKSHIEMVKKYNIPFALFAGGVPSQVADLEKAGTKTYLHTPSVSMLENAVKNGCTRFIFEGTEAGGHVGSLSSLVLWEAAAARLLEKYDRDLSSLSLVFAGGISSCFASYFMSGMTSHLAARGAKIGLQVGTAYLFTREITETGSMTKQYQQIISKENRTVVVGKSVGLASRTAPTEFAKMMLETEQEMIAGNDSLDKRKRSFEKKNLGSLLIGAKGFLPDFNNPGPEHYQYFDDKEHRERGNFLVGDSLAFLQAPLAIADVHARYFSDKNTLFENLNQLETFSSETSSIHDEIAVVGMGCVLPGADTPEKLWENIITKQYAIKEMPEDRLDRTLYYDADKKAEDKTYTLLAGIVDDYEFDGERFGYSQEKAARLSRSQMMVLEAAYRAVENAGCLGEDNRLICDNPERTAVIIATCLGNELGNDLQFKYFMPEILEMLGKTPEYGDLSSGEKEELKNTLREGFEGKNRDYDPVHGMLLNIEASRIARHLGVRGVNYVVDAACASSFAAFEAATGELLSGEHDQVIVGGVNTHLAPESFIGFSKMGTLSAKGSFPFDERADGFILGEGSAVFVLKRMKDAVRDNDHILGVINAIGASSDGKGKGIAAPNPEGQRLSIERCFENARRAISPAEITFIEAHGTATIIGDQAELGTLKKTYGNATAGISSIKSQIGHLLGCAGAAGFMKALLAINNRTLPPNGRFDTPSPAADTDGSSLFIIKESQKWETDGGPRRAAVCSYGFGGINYHMIVQEMTEEYTPLPRQIFTDPAYDFNDDRIVFAGMGVVLPGAQNTDQFWETLVSGENQLSEIPEDRFSNRAYAKEGKDSFYRLPLVKAGIVKDFNFNNLKYKMPPAVVRSIERGQLFGLEAADEAIASSGLSQHLGKGNRTGVILGTISGERQNKNILRVRKHLVERIITSCKGIDKSRLTAMAERIVSDIKEKIPANNGDTTPGLLSNIISGRIANIFGLNGANYVVDASCASAAIAIRNAARDVAFKNLDFVLAGGVDTNLFPPVLMAFKRLGLLSEGDCRFFDERADGYIMGEGAAVHVMTTRKKAKEAGMEILGELNGFSVKSSVPDHLLSPSGPVFASAINACYSKSGVRKQDICHLDLFAFSNVFGDMVEKQVVESCFKNPVYCGNIKPQLGYFRAANPAVALAKMMLMNKKSRILPDFNYSEKHSTITGASVLKPAGELVSPPDGRQLKFASNVNGIGGNHCHIIAGALPAFLDRQAESAAKSTEETIQLRNYSYSADNSGEKLRMVALLSGQGAQRSGMMRLLFENDPHIRKMMEKGEDLFRQARGYSLLDMMFAQDDDRLNLMENTQPAVFLSSAALFDRLHMEGFSPDYFIGHSLGEYTALFCNGMLSFDDTMRLVIKRADLMSEAGQKYPGRIMVVFKNEKETESLIRESFLSHIYITNKNSEKQTAVSGKTGEIDRFCTFLQEKEVFHKKLNLSGAFHTPLLNEASQKLRAYLDTVRLNETRFGRIISNTYGRPYPERRHEVKDILAGQIVSPVEFIKSVEQVYAQGRTHFIEIGPSKLLVTLLKNINIADYGTAVTVDHKIGEIESFKKCRDYLKSYNAIFTEPAPAPPPDNTAEKTEAAADTDVTAPEMAHGEDFETFKKNNADLVNSLLYEAYQRQKREAAIKALENYDFNTGRIVISGVSVGLPGKTRKVFARDNFDAILEGRNFIETLSPEDQARITDKNITKLYKQPDGSAKFVKITKTEDVIHLAGQLGYFDLTDEYGIKEQYDISMALGIAAGIEALKDAGIPLVMQYKASNGGSRMIPDGFALPAEMQEETGVIITSLFPNGETLISEMENYYYQKLFLKPYEAFEKIYYYLMEKVGDIDVKEQLTEWFFKAKSGKRRDFKEYKFDRNFLVNACPLGSAHLAQIIKAKGPNTLVSSACASTTQAIGIAEDWIRVGRCRRVLVIGGENATSEAQNQWIGSGFLALGAATIKKRVSEAAKPFDEDRNGTILGSGAVGLVVENEADVKARGMSGQAEILGTHMANSGYHAFNIDVPHMSREMKKFIGKVEKRHNLKKEDYADKLLFMSHETYTPARGGSADAEVTALETSFSDHLKNICISNTKGFTGHTLGAAIEDVVMVKALQKRKAPPIANLQKIPAHFENLNFSSKSDIACEYGLHLAAGFGSHFAFLFVKRIEENAFENNPGYTAWLKKISGVPTPALKIIDNTLCVVAGSEVPESREPAAAPREMPAPPREPRPQPETAAVERAETPAPVQAAEANAFSGTEDSSRPAATVKSVKEIIAGQTGYTRDMLEDDLDLEADLGIDTVKQVEIFGKVAATFGFDVPEDLRLSDLNTIAKLSDYIAGKTADHAAALDAAGPAADTETAETGDAAEGGQAFAGGAPAAETPSDAAAKVKTIISVQTGYPEDMLEHDLDLEADLGIDTVKQVEIFGKVAATFGFDVPEDLRLSDLNTIAKLSDYIAGKTADHAAALDAAGPAADTETAETGDAAEGGQAPAGGAAAGTKETAEVPAQADSPDPSLPVKRLTLKAVESDTPEPAAADFNGKRIVVSVDSHGFAEKIAEKIKGMNGRVITVGQNDNCDFQMDFTDVSQTEKDAAAFRQSYGEVDGFVHLSPLDFYFKKGNRFDAELNTTVKSLFVMIKALFDTLNRPGSLIGTITFDSVVQPYLEDCGPVHPAFGGAAGLLKTVNKEMPETCVKIVDFSYKQPKKSINRIAALFLKELLIADPKTEIGYRRGQRYVLSMKPERAQMGDKTVAKGDTLLVTGGAGGITYEILKAVVDRYAVNLVILDINDIFATPEKYLDRHIGRADLMEMVKTDMPGAKPLDIKQKVDALMRVRQTFDNLAHLESRGIDVTYHCTDVTDADAVQQAVDSCEKIDGVLHAAGLEMSQFIPKKTLSSFELVVDVKVKGLMHLLRALEDRDYRYFFTFSSVTAKFGNEGQSDYTAANDLLCKTLFRERQLHPDRTYKVYAWTAWSDVGMATNPTVKKVLEDKGVAFLPLRQGIHFFMADLLDKTETEMVFSGLDYEFDRDGILQNPYDTAYPFLDEVVEKTDKSVTYSRVLDLERDLFLYDHTMNGVPLFLGATGIEAMAQAARTLTGDDRHLVAVTDFSIPYGIKILKGRPKALLITGEKAGDGVYNCRITSQFKRPDGAAMGDPMLHYQATCKFAKTAPTPEKIDLPPFNPVYYDMPIQELVYNPQRLFMFGLFSTIADINSFDGTTLVTTVKDASRKAFFKGVTQPNFIAAPILVDAIFQTGGLVEFFSTNRTVLPYKIGTLQFYGKLSKGTPYYCITEKVDASEETNCYDLKLVDKKGNLFISVDRFEMVKLHKLAAKDAVSDKITY